MIVIVDRFVEGHLHVLANVNTIKILNLIYPTRQKTFVAEDSHTNLVAKYFDAAEFKQVEFTPYKNKKYPDAGKVKQGIRVLSRLKTDIAYFFSLFKSFSKKEDALVFITHVYPLSLFFVKLTKLFFPKVKLIITIHGEVEYLFYGKSRYERLIGMLYGLSFKLKTANTFYLFLTKVSKKIMIESKKLDEKKIIAIILPALPTAKLQKNEKSHAVDLIQIGHIGSAGRRKNTQYLYQLASNFKDEIQDAKVAFSVVGPLERNILPDVNIYVENFVQGKAGVHLDREVYDLQANKLDYSIFFYAKNDFVLRSSAAFFDAIYFEKPLIVMRNDFFESIFEEAGNIGYICDSLYEISEVIKNIISNNSDVKDEYQLQLKNILEYKKSLSLEIVSSDLKHQLDDFKLLQ